MKTTRLMTFFAFAVSLFFAASTFAATHEGEKARQDQKTMQKTGAAQNQQGQQDRNLFSANWLIGNKVVNRQGQDLGEVANVILDQETGKAAYLTVTSGGFLNLGEERHIVPYKALKIQGNQILLDMDKQKLTQAPKPEQGLSTEEFDRRTSEFFGVSPFWE